MIITIVFCLVEDERKVYKKKACATGSRLVVGQDKENRTQDCNAEASSVYRRPSSVGQSPHVGTTDFCTMLLFIFSAPALSPGVAMFGRA